MWSIELMLCAFPEGCFRGAESPGRYTLSALPTFGLWHRCHRVLPALLDHEMTLRMKADARMTEQKAGGAGVSDDCGATTVVPDSLPWDSYMLA